MHDVVSGRLPRRSLLTALMTLGLGGLTGLAGLGLLAGCDTDDSGMGEVELVGVADDGETFIAIVADDETIAVYTCDGTEDGVNTFEWLVGSNVDGTFDLSGSAYDMGYGSEDATVSGSFADDGSASGTLSLGDLDLSFTVTSASGDEGLYFAEEGDRYGGWVLIGDSVRGAVINRLQTGSITGINFTPSVGSVEFQGITLTPLKQSVLDYK